MSENRERDLVLNPNEYAYVLDKTKGLISCVVGSYKMSLSTSDALVVFNEANKRFEEATYSEAVTTFVSAPENWYITLKNPTKDEKHPSPGTSNQLPDLQIGKKVNIKGNCSFALYPGQMAKVIQGHRLHSNQYLLARVYDPDVLEKEVVEKEIKELNENGETVVVDTAREETNKYTVGQLLVIKGTETSFYIPPTGIEVLPVGGGKSNTYVRDAVTLERLEYCILKDEEGNKEYIHGAAVVFPKPDQTFLKNPTGGLKFKAIELSEISGVYVKVIADYEENGRKYKTGEELFITGKEQMIYYPRAEHAIIDYDGKVIHHAIAIPNGEGRYVLNRKTGQIKTVKGPIMYLPNPIDEVIVNRKLTRKECELWYPGNREVLKHNVGEDQDIQDVYDNFRSYSTASYLGLNSSNCNLTSKGITLDSLDNGFLGQSNAVVEDGGFSRGNTYSKPRSITIDNKYDGVVSIDVWTGYAIDVVSKSGQRKIVMGPQTYLMEYDESLEVLSMSTGTPKDEKALYKTVFLRVDNNKVSDRVDVQTKDFVDARINLSYCLNFDEKYKDKWFSVENYVKLLTDRLRSVIKKEVKEYTIEEFYSNYSDIVRDAVLGIDPSNESETNGDYGKRTFKENGMVVYDVEVSSVQLEESVGEIFQEHQENMITKTLEVSHATKEIEVANKLAELEKQKADIEYEAKMYKLELENKFEKENLIKSEELNREKEKAELAEKTAEQNIQKLIDQIAKAELTREKAKSDADIERKKSMDQLAIDKQNAMAEAVKKVVESVSPDLIAAMITSANAELMSSVTESMSPYAIAKGESISDVTNKLLRGTSLEGLVDRIVNVIPTAE